MQSLIDQDLSAVDRRQKLRSLAKLALSLSEAAAEGKNDYFIAGQVQLIVRYFAQAVEPSPTYPNLEAVLDFLGMCIQTEVGRAHKPQATAAKAVAPVHETELEPTGETAVTNGR